MLPPSARSATTRARSSLRSSFPAVPSSSIPASRRKSTAGSWGRLRRAASTRTRSKRIFPQEECVNGKRRKAAARAGNARSRRSVFSATPGKPSGNNFQPILLLADPRRLRSTVTGPSLPSASESEQRRPQSGTRALSCHTRCSRGWDCLTRRLRCGLLQARVCRSVSSPD